MQNSLLKANAQKKTTQDPKMMAILHDATGFSGSFGEVISIAWAIDDKPVQCVYRTSLEPGKEQHSFFRCQTF